MESSNVKLTNTPNKRLRDQIDQQPLVINITYTQYEIIHEVSQCCNMRTSMDEEEDWDVWFIDAAIIPALLTKMKPY